MVENIQTLILNENSLSAFQSHGVSPILHLNLQIMDKICHPEITFRIKTITKIYIFNQKNLIHKLILF